MLENIGKEPKFLSISRLVYLTGDRGPCCVMPESPAVRDTLVPNSSLSLLSFCKQPLRMISYGFT